MTGLTRLVRAWHARVAVRGHSMEPSLRDGDWLLVDPDAYRGRQPVPGELVVAASPVDLVVKRLTGISADGSAHLAGDRPSEAGHGHETTVPPGALLGRPFYRYWPPGRIGRVR